MACKAATMQEQSEILSKNEESAPRPTAAESVRTLIKNQKYGTVCTMASSGPASGYPSGALMPYAVDDKGRVMACLSNLSGHKRCEHRTGYLDYSRCASCHVVHTDLACGAARRRPIRCTELDNTGTPCSCDCASTPACRDLQTDGRGTLVVANGGFSSMSDARCTITGTFTEVTDEADAAACREAYMAKHPEAYWVDFGDFSYLRMDEVVTANYIGGFGRAAKARCPLCHACQCHLGRTCDFMCTALPACRVQRP